MASLAFGTVAALSKIRRIWSGGSKDFRVISGQPWVPVPEAETKVTRLVSRLQALEVGLGQTAYEVISLKKARKLLRLRRTLAYDMGSAELKYLKMVLNSCAAYVQNMRTLHSEILSVTYEATPGV
jgi:hypothetical protein